MRPLRVCVLEDPRSRSRRLAQLLRRTGLTVEESEDAPDELIEKLAQRLPSIALVDLSHASGDRLGAIERLARNYPSMKVLGLLDRDDGPRGHRCRRSGAWDCLVKPRAVRELVAEIDAAHHAQVRPVPPGLTARELEVLRHIGAGEDNLKIAAQLGIRERTVKAHITSLYRKLDAQSRVELALFGRILG